jgi:hypothetical protein
LATQSATAVASSGSHLAVIDGQSLKIVDVTIPTAPLLLGTSTSYSAQAVDIMGNYAFLVTRQTDEVSVVDVTVPSAPLLIRQVITPGSPAAVVATPSYAYVSDAAAIVDVIDLVP